MIFSADVFRQKYVKCHTTLSEHVGKIGKMTSYKTIPSRERVWWRATFRPTDLYIHSLKHAPEHSSLSLDRFCLTLTAQLFPGSSSRIRSCTQSWTQSEVWGCSVSFWKLSAEMTRLDAVWQRLRERGKGRRISATRRSAPAHKYLQPEWALSLTGLLTTPLFPR